MSRKTFTISELLFKPNKKTAELGVELEVEFPRDTFMSEEIKIPFLIKADGSLRNYGLEFISRKPSKFSKLFKNDLKRLVKEIREKGGIDNCDRTSFHVHLNVLNMDIRHYWNLIILYYFLEEVLINYCGESRKNNIFCLTLKDGNDYLEVLEGCLASFSKMFSRLNQNSCKYSSCNIFATKQQGSLEFRAMEGCLDSERLLTWCSQLIHLKNRALEFDNPEILYAYLIEAPLEEIVRRFLIEPVARYVGERVIENNLYANMSDVGFIVFNIDWDGEVERLITAREGLTDSSKREYTPGSFLFTVIDEVVDV